MKIDWSSSLFIVFVIINYGCKLALYLILLVLTTPLQVSRNNWIDGILFIYFNCHVLFWINYHLIVKVFIFLSSHIPPSIEILLPSNSCYSTYCPDHHISGSDLGEYGTCQSLPPLHPELPSMTLSRPCSEDASDQSSSLFSVSESSGRVQSMFSSWTTGWVSVCRKPQSGFYTSDCTSPK